MGHFQNLSTRLLNAARSNPCYLDTWTYDWPRRGPNGEKWAINVHVFGAENPAAALVVTDGEHGAETHIGNETACHIAALDIEKLVGQGNALYIIDTVCPPGADNDERGDDLNIDGNRAGGPVFVDRFDYSAFRKYAHVAMINENSRADMRKLMAGTDMEKARQVLLGGQHSDREGLSYGGIEGESASVSLTQEIYLRILQTGVSRIAILHLHSGLGVKDQIIVVSLTESEHIAELIRQYIADDRIQYRGLKSGGAVNETIYGTFPQWMEALASPQAEVMSLTFELGGEGSPQTSLPIMLERNWIKHNPKQLPPEEEQAIIDRFMRIFWLPDDEEWRKLYVRESIALARKMGRFLQERR